MTDLVDIVRSRPFGRPRAFGSAEELRNECLAYLEWLKDNPLYEAKLVQYQGDTRIEKIPKLRAATIEGLCLYINIDRETWRRYRSNQDFCGVVREIDDALRVQKFEGAAAELLNANIIARDLGLSEKQETNVSLTFSLDPHDKDA